MPRTQHLLNVVRPNVLGTECKGDVDVLLLIAYLILRR